MGKSVEPSWLPSVTSLSFPPSSASLSFDFTCSVCRFHNGDIFLFVSVSSKGSCGSCLWAFTLACDV
jgi:hypothetical protein